MSMRFWEEFLKPENRSGDSFKIDLYKGNVFIKQRILETICVKTHEDDSYVLMNFRLCAKIIASLFEEKCQLFTRLENAEKDISSLKVENNQLKEEVKTLSDFFKAKMEFDTQVIDQQFNKLNQNA